MTQIPPEDTEYKEVTIDKVVPGETYHSIVGSDGWSFGCPKGPFLPQPGQTARLYGPFPGMIRGIVIDGTVFLYRTPEQQAAWQAEQMELARR